MSHNTSRVAGTGTAPGRPGESTSAPEPVWSKQQLRFLKAYRQRPTISAAARSAGVPRVVVFRWLADARFFAAVSETEKVVRATPPAGGGGTERGRAGEPDARPAAETPSVIVTPPPRKSLRDGS